MAETQTQPTIGIKTEVNIDEQRVADVLTNGIEGGIGYWATIDNSDEGMNIPNELSEVDGNRFTKIAMTPGGSIDIYDAENPNEKLGQLNKINVIKGLQLMADNHPKHFADILNENDDAWTADALIQLAVMGEIVFG